MKTSVNNHSPFWLYFFLNTQALSPGHLVKRGTPMLGLGGACEPVFHEIQVMLKLLGCISHLEKKGLRDPDAHETCP